MLTKVNKSTLTANKMVVYQAPNELKNMIGKFDIDGKPVEYDLFIKLKDAPEDGKKMEMEFITTTENSALDTINIGDPHGIYKYIDAHWFGPVRLDFDNITLTYNPDSKFIYIKGESIKGNVSREDFFI